MGVYLILQINQLIETILKGPCSNMGNNHTEIEKNSDEDLQACHTAQDCLDIFQNTR